VHCKKWAVYCLTWAQWRTILYQIIPAVKPIYILFVYTFLIYCFFSLDVIETALSVMVHPSQAARLSAAWCIRCVCIALPSQCTPLIDRYILYLSLFSIK